LALTQWTKVKAGTHADSLTIFAQLALRMT